MTATAEGLDIPRLSKAGRADPRLRWSTVDPHDIRPITSADLGVPQPGRPSKKATLNSVELFAGAGGLALGTQKAGFASLATLEWNRWACDTIRENKAAGHPLVKDWTVFQGDVREFDWSGLDRDIDLVSGGPPCQPFSSGGRGKSVDDERDMFPATADVLESLSPRAFIIENVRGLTRPAFQDYYEYVLRRLSSPQLKANDTESWFDHLQRLRKDRTQDALRYDVFPTLLNAADFGIPQQRHRVFMVGFRSDLGIDWEFPEPTHSRSALVQSQWVTGDYWERHRVSNSMRPKPPSDATIARLAPPSGKETAWRTLRDALVGLPDPKSKSAFKFRNHEFQPGARIYKGHTGAILDAPAKTLKAGTHGVPGGENMIRFEDGSVRYLTVRESARVQTFPDNYELHGAWGEAMRQLGNAVPVELASSIAGAVRQALSINDD